jgi:hypothetical protein
MRKIQLVVAGLITLIGSFVCGFAGTANASYACQNSKNSIGVQVRCYSTDQDGIYRGRIQCLYWWGLSGWNYSYPRALNSGIDSIVICGSGGTAVSHQYFVTGGSWRNV